MMQIEILVLHQLLDESRLGVWSLLIGRPVLPQDIRHLFDLLVIEEVPECVYAFLMGNDVLTLKLLLQPATLYICWRRGTTSR
jgi:hypothetical protein